MSKETRGPGILSYAMVYVALLVLTGLTVGVAYMQFSGRLGVIVAMVIASLKITLVGIFFMHLKFEGKTIHVVVAIPILMAVLLVMALYPDVVHSLKSLEGLR